MVKFHIGCAGWNLPAEYRDKALSHLERYTQLFNCVEINSSFYRPHKKTTYVRWAAAVPSDFRFAVKVPKAISHQNDAVHEVLFRFFDEVSGLGEKLGALLLQYPPKRAFKPQEREIFELFRGSFHGNIVFEPRHSSWFYEEARQLLAEFQVSAVLADPQPTSIAPLFTGPVVSNYYRLHGSPHTYYSEYSDESLKVFTQKLLTAKSESWVIFDNTAAGHAQKNALSLARMLSG